MIIIQHTGPLHFIKKTRIKIDEIEIYTPWHSNIRKEFRHFHETL